MGKGLQNQDACISPKSPQGCMSGILHNFNHNRHRKRLPHKRKGGGKRVAGEERMEKNDKLNSFYIRPTICLLVS